MLWARWGPDWPAQEFRAWVAARHGLVAWTGQWYGGQPLWGYSALYPVVAGTFGAAATGLFAVVATTWISGRLAPVQPVRRRLFAVAVAVSLLECLLIGQVPFLLGVLFATGALVALAAGGRAFLIAAAAAACSLCSPLAGVGLALAVPAVAGWLGRRRAALLVPSLTGAVLAHFFGGAEGVYSFAAPALGMVLAFCAATVLATHGKIHGLTLFAGTYAVAAVLAFVVPNPVGGNLVRIGTTVVLPLAVRFLPSEQGPLRRAGAVVLVVLALVWPAWSSTSAALRGAGDPSRQASYYTGLIRFLQTQDMMGGRVEIPFTREHWESLYVAKDFPIVRGWERQTDLLYNDVLYHPLTAARYRRWLDDNAAHYVALSHSPIDYGGRAERNLLAHPPSYLVPVWHDANWQVWRVRDPVPLATGIGRLISVGTSTMRLRFTRAGGTLIRTRFGPLWQITHGHGCLSASAGGWLHVKALAAGTIDLSAGMNDDMLAATPRCNQ